MNKMKYKYFIIIVSVFVAFLVPIKASSATIRDNHLNFDADRLSQKENDTLGQQSSMVKDLFNPDQEEQLAKSKDGKKALTSQESQLFQKGKTVMTSTRQNHTKLFQTRVTHTLDIKEGQGEESWNWFGFWLYTGIIAITLVTAAVFSWWINKKEDLMNNGIY